MNIFRRGWTAGGSGATGQFTHVQLWVPKAADVVAHLRRVVVHSPHGWHLVMTSTRLGNQPFGSSPRLRNGISGDGMFRESGCEMRDERRSAVDAAMLGSLSGIFPLEWERDSLVCRPNMDDPGETGVGITVRSEGTAAMRVMWEWEEENRLVYEERIRGE